MLRTIGADVVGMSMALETIAARAAGAEVLGLAVVTNAGGHRPRVYHRDRGHCEYRRCRRTRRGRHRPPRNRLAAMSRPLIVTQRHVSDVSAEQWE